MNTPTESIANHLGNRGRPMLGSFDWRRGESRLFDERVARHAAWWHGRGERKE